MTRQRALDTAILLGAGALSLVVAPATVVLDKAARAVGHLDWALYEIQSGYAYKYRKEDNG